jgi:putative endonuclease
MCLIYAIKSRVRKYTYVGLINNPKRHIQQYEAGREKTTSPYKPFTAILLESYNTRAEARNREKYLKSGVGKECLKSL